MFKNQPKGLLAASLSNMGERFGFYIMMAILTLFLMAKFGLDEVHATIVYSVFYFAIYGLSLLGGIIADKTKKYKKTIQYGIILMAIGYLIIAIPSPTPVRNKAFFLTIICIGLFAIALGNGLFKGNLQALIGQMYDNEKYEKLRDSGFSLFYMFINIGSIFAPLIAVGIRNWWLKSHGLCYNAGLPERCYEYLNNGSHMTADKISEFAQLATNVNKGIIPTDLTAFSKTYLDVFTTGFHYAFGIAIIAMLISLGIYLFNKKKFPDPGAKKKAERLSNISVQEAQMNIKEIKQRIYALCAVFAVVIFFWLTFNQNGATLTFFAKDYVNLSHIKINLGFVVLEGAELFQSANPLFVVLLTPLLLGLFGFLRSRGKEPSTPKKIAIGMGIAAVAFIILIIASTSLPDKSVLRSMDGGLPITQQVNPFFLIGSYLVISIAELFISPLGLSFVSKVAPPKYQGLMQGCWLGTTALANLFLWVGAELYTHTPLWFTWIIFVIACLFSMIIMFCMLKWLERITK